MSRNSCTSSIPFYSTSNGYNNCGIRSVCAACGCCIEILKIKENGTKDIIIVVRSGWFRLIYCLQKIAGEFQPDSFKTERLVCVEMDGQTDRRTWLDRLV